MSTTATAIAARKTAKSVEMTACHCGCETPTKSTYAPGHDARHVSQLLAKVRSKEVTVAAAKKQLPSDALKAKLDRAIANAAARDEDRKIKQAEREAAKEAKRLANAEAAAKKAKAA